MSRFVQKYAVICGNGHVETTYLNSPAEPGVGAIPKRCRKCSAPTFSRCSGCNEPIYGDRQYHGIISTHAGPTPWFCHACGKPYIWASAEQMRAWFENRLKFDETLDEDVQDELLDMLALLTPGEPDAPPMDFTKFKNLLKKLPALYKEVRPLLPALRGLFM